eukprot:TRINITY_DN30554_c0_g1_i1.p1 TRINITY_DN30554_c0_g1~~TRINITY_DN30554_c0_g1_i1.p1  ORF type:complete len:549 (+),score=128.53 TRINITY_DN30554_c0_g1_i1:173-1819(+)
MLCGSPEPFVGWRTCTSDPLPIPAVAHQDDAQVAREAQEAQVRHHTAKTLAVHALRAQKDILKWDTGGVSIPTHQRKVVNLRGDVEAECIKLPHRDLSGYPEVPSAASSIGSVAALMTVEAQKRDKARLSSEATTRPVAPGKLKVRPQQAKREHSTAPSKRSEPPSPLTGAQKDDDGAGGDVEAGGGDVTPGRRRSHGSVAPVVSAEMKAELMRFRDSFERFKLQQGVLEQRARIDRKRQAREGAGRSPGGGGAHVIQSAGAGTLTHEAPATASGSAKQRRAHEVSLSVPVVERKAGSRASSSVPPLPNGVRTQYHRRYLRMRFQNRLAMAAAAAGDRPDAIDRATAQASPSELTTSARVATRLLELALPNLPQRGGHGGEAHSDEGASALPPLALIPLNSARRAEGTEAPPDDSCTTGHGNSKPGSAQRADSPRSQDDDDDDDGASSCSSGAGGTQPAPRAASAHGSLVTAGKVLYPTPCGAVLESGGALDSPGGGPSRFPSLMQAIRDAEQGLCNDIASDLAAPSRAKPSHAKKKKSKRQRKKGKS